MQIDAAGYLVNERGFALLSIVNGSSGTAQPVNVFGLNTAPTANAVSELVISSDGQIVSVRPNGERVDIGRIVLADFANTSELEQVDDTLLRATSASGEAFLGFPETGDFGSVNELHIDVGS